VGRPPSRACPARSRRVRRAKAGFLKSVDPPQCSPSLSSAISNPRRHRRSDHHRTGRPASRVGHHRPNTGGKTVILKNCRTPRPDGSIRHPSSRGPCPAPVFDAILADIGDYQSIEQNLSTFSAHVTNIDFISRTATGSPSCCWTNSAPLPTQKRCRSCSRDRRSLPPDGQPHVISTHHTSLKVYGVTHRE